MRGSGLSGFKKIEIERWDYAELGQSSDFKIGVENEFQPKKWSHDFCCSVDSFDLGHKSLVAKNGKLTLKLAKIVKYLNDICLFCNWQEVQIGCFIWEVKR